jgi:hypothetical protein
MVCASRERGQSLDSSSASAHVRSIGMKDRPIAPFFPHFPDIGENPLLGCEPAATQR